MSKAGTNSTQVPVSGTDLTTYIRRVVRTVAFVKRGTQIVTRQVIAEALGMGESVDEVAFALEVFDAMIDRDMIAKGVLNVTPEVQGMLDVPDVTGDEDEAEPEGPVRRTQPAAEGRLVTVPLGQVVVWSMNPRKRIDSVSIEEMADSILELDIVQAPIARPGRYVDTWEVISGQRRLLGKRRAVEKAKELGREPVVETIQLNVREMDDREALAVAWAENLQSCTMSARDEVEGFEQVLAMKDEQGRRIYSVTSWAAKIGKSTEFVSRRLRLQNAPRSMWDAYEAGKISLRHMEEVGRLPKEAARKAAADEVLRPSFRGGEHPLTVLETVAMLREKFMVSLRTCGWDLDDAELVPARWDREGKRTSGGACKDCPMRTGADEELQNRLATGKGGARGVDAYSCLMPACFEEKREALWARTQREASEAGSRVLSPEEAKRTFYAWGAGGPAPASGLVSLSGYPGFPETGHHAAEDTMPTWGEMIRKVEAKDVVIGRNEATGEIHRMLKRERAIELAEEGLKKKGKDSPFANRPGLRKETPAAAEVDGGEAEDEGEEEVSPWRRQAEENARIGEAVSRELRRMVELERVPSDEVLVELVAGSLFEAVGYGDAFLRLIEASGVPEFEGERGAEGEGVREYLEAVVKPHLARAPLAWAALALLEVYEQVVRWSSPPESESLLQALGLDREEILAEDTKA